MGFFRRHQGRGSYDLFSNYAHYLPDVGGMCLLFVMFLIGALLGNIIVLALGMVSAEFAAIYGVVISYPVMFIPPLLYASAQSRRNEYFDLGYALDSNNFGRMGGWKLGLIVSIATIAAAFMTDSLTKIMPEAPQWFEDAMNSIMDAPTWLTLLSVSIFAPVRYAVLANCFILSSCVPFTALDEAETVALFSFEEVVLFNAEISDTIYIYATGCSSIVNAPALTIWHDIICAG